MFAEHGNDGEHEKYGANGKLRTPLILKVESRFEASLAVGWSEYINQDSIQSLASLRQFLKLGHRSCNGRGDGNCGDGVSMYSCTK